MALKDFADTMRGLSGKASENLIKMSGYDPAALNEEQKEQAKLAGLRELSDRLFQASAKLSGDPRKIKLAQERELAKMAALQPKTQAAKIGALWKDQQTGNSFRELVVGDKIFYKSPSTGQTYTIEEMKELFPNVRPSTAGEESRYFSDFGAFRKESSELLSTEQAIGRLNNYLDNLQKTPIGMQRLYQKITTAIKTIAGDSDLTEQEVAQKIASGNLQGLVGSNRLEIAGPGVLTEQDWQRILDALGGDVSLLQNPSIVYPLINDILENKIKTYNEKADFYNAAVDSGNYPGQFERKERKIFKARTYLPEGIPKSSTLIGVEGDTLIYQTPEGKILQYTE